MPVLKRLPTLGQLRHLVAIADYGHFNRAAEATLVTQSTISASIKELEMLLGATLVERTRRTVRMTSLGEEVTTRARDILSDTGDLVDLVQASGEPLSGNLRLGVIPTIAPFLLPRVLPGLRNAWPISGSTFTRTNLPTFWRACGAGPLISSSSPFLFRRPASRPTFSPMTPSGLPFRVGTGFARQSA